MAPYGNRSRIALRSIRSTRSGRSAALPRHLKRRFSKAFQVSNCIRDVIGEPRYRLTITTAERSTVGTRAPQHGEAREVQVVEVGVERPIPRTSCDRAPRF